MSRQRPLGRNEWWAVRRVGHRFLLQRTLSSTQAGARELFMAQYRDDPGHEHFHNWRNWREGRHGLARHEVVRVEIVEVIEDE